MDYDDERELIVHEWEDGNRWFRARINQFRGRVYCDIRQYYEPSPGEPLMPTKRGVSVQSDSLDELEHAVAAFKQALANGGRVRRTVTRSRDDDAA